MVSARLPALQLPGPHSHQPSELPGPGADDPPVPLSQDANSPCSCSAGCRSALQWDTGSRACTAGYLHRATAGEGGASCTGHLLNDIHPIPSQFHSRIGDGVPSQISASTHDALPRPPFRTATLKARGPHHTMGRVAEAVRLVGGALAAARQAACVCRGAERGTAWRGGRGQISRNAPLIKTFIAPPELCRQFKCRKLNSRGSLHRFGVDFCTRDGYALVLQLSRKGVCCCLSCWRGIQYGGLCVHIQPVGSQLAFAAGVNDDVGDFCSEQVCRWRRTACVAKTVLGLSLAS